MGDGESRQVSGQTRLPPLPSGWNADDALAFREDYLNGDMSRWQHLIDLGTELKVTQEGWDVLHWATLFHISGRDSVKRRRELMAAVPDGGTDPPELLGDRMRRHVMGLSDGR